ncbi:MaoC family dehydratase [Nocardioides sp. NPDC057577]|uniref:MaoC family dehydratase n=1 Tax=Nocardioides sp. NPDC057577 TaxID=3346171 RepID=UPI00366ED1D6
MVADRTADNGTRVGRRIEQRGLWFEEFEIGTTYVHRPGRTVTEADNVFFTTLTMNTQPLHLDQAASEALAPFHDRLVNSMFTLSTMVGLSVNQLTQGTIVANLGFSEIAFPAPVRHGDTLYAETLVTAKRPSGSRPGEGVVALRHEARNQRGETVAIAVRQTLVRMRPEGGGA